MVLKELYIKNTGRLVSMLESIRTNPYENYTAFSEDVRMLMDSSTVDLGDFHAVPRIFACEAAGNRKVVLLHGCPIDRTVPIFDQDDPVHDKHRVKNTFVGEALLELISQCSMMPILSYTTRNCGDFFQDVYSQNQFTGTQTQKTDSDLYWHNDRPRCQDSCRLT